MSSSPPTHLHPSSHQRSHSPVHSAELLSTPLDVVAIATPANVARPQAPRRMSISDSALLSSALEHAFSNDGHHASLSRPGSAEAKRRAHTRFHVPTAFRTRLGATADTEDDDASHTEVFCLSYAPDSNTLAAGCGDGSIRVFDSSKEGAHRLQKLIKHQDGRECLPVTCLRFKVTEKQQPGDAMTLLAAEADGRVSQWRFGPLGAKAECVRSTSTGSGNSVYALAYAPDFRSWACAGRDHVVRTYDESTGQLIRSMEKHSNRVYSLHYSLDDPHLLLSGGWDNTVQFWDTRAGYSQRSVFGPHICGDALDIHPVTGAEFLTGSWREQDALQRWDLATGKLIESLEWQGKEQRSSHATTVAKSPSLEQSEAAAASSSSSSSEAASSSSSSLAGSLSAEPSTNCMLYAASYSPDGMLIAAGGGGNGINQAKIFSTLTGKPAERVTFQHGLYALAFAPGAQHLALGGVDSNLTILNL